MASRIPTMTDSRRSVTDEEIISLLKSRRRPVWTTSSIAEELDITRQTAHTRLKKLENDSSMVTSINVGQATAYYVRNIATLPGETIEEQHRYSIIEEYTDKFVGLETEPWTAVHPHDGPAEGGDKIQLWVQGVPNRWSTYRSYTWDERRDKLYEEQLEKDRTQALISGELYEKPTVPVKHMSWPDDCDLESNLGTEWHDIESEGGNRRVLVAYGRENYLLQARNDAVFLDDVSVDWISPKGEGKEVETGGITEEVVEKFEEWRREQLEDDSE